MEKMRPHLLWRDPRVPDRFRTGVSLHSHTMHSEECLASLPRYLRRIPIARTVFRMLEERYRLATGRPFDYSRAYWTPPLPGHVALAVERDQIENGLGLASLVSLTDHDSILAGARLQVLESARGIPLSLEWTVPQGSSFLHLGIHNLPPARAHAWVREMAAFTRRPSRPILVELLAGLNGSKETLIVLNHPLWDEPRIGAPAHFRMVREFLRDHGPWIHALEVNGLRPWAENQTVMRLAWGLGYPVVSGGDRHGSAANTVLNLTRAPSFGEFVDEVRERRASEILVMPQYRGPHDLRYIECTLDIVREYPELAGRRDWMDRAFCREQDGSALPLSAYWGAGYLSLGTWLLSLTRLCHSRALRSAIKAALAVCQESPV